MNVKTVARQRNSKIIHKVEKCTVILKTVNTALKESDVTYKSND
jgi:hypothetical protein